MESLISKINNFIGIDDSYYDSYDNVLDDSIENIKDVDQSNYFLGLFKKNIYEFGKSKRKSRQAKKKKDEINRSKVSDSIIAMNTDEEGNYNYSRLIRFTVKDTTTNTVNENVHYDNTHVSHRFAITDYGAAIIRDTLYKYYGINNPDTANDWTANITENKDAPSASVPPNTQCDINACGWLTGVSIDIDVNQVQSQNRKKGYKMGRIANFRPSRNIKTADGFISNPDIKKRREQVESAQLSRFKADVGGTYELDRVQSENDKDGYTWIEARGPDNPPRLRYYKIMMFAADRKDTNLTGGADKHGNFHTGYNQWPDGWAWFHNQPAGSTNLAADFNAHGLHIDPKRTNTDSAFWNTPGRVAAETWFPPIKKQDSPSDNSDSGKGNLTTFLSKYAIQQAFYPDKDRNDGVDTPDLFSPNLEFALVSSEDLDAAMLASQDAELDAEMLEEAMKARQAKMLNAMSDVFPPDPLDRLRSFFLYDNLLTIHIGTSNRSAEQESRRAARSRRSDARTPKAGLNGAVINPYINQSGSKPSFYKTVTKVTPDHDEIMTNFITDVKERTIYICSNVLLGISFCFLPYLKFPTLDVLVHSLAYDNPNQQPGWVPSKLPLTSKFAALFFALQTSLITSLKTNAAPLCAIIGLTIITMTLPTIHYKPGSRAKQALRSNFEGLLFVNLCYMVISLYPTMSPNKTIEQALYSMFFPPGAEFDDVLSNMLPLFFMILLQLFLSTDFLVFNIWFICVVPAVCLLIFPLFRTLARYAGGNMGDAAAKMIDKISNNLVEDSVNTADDETGLSMMGLVTKIILVLAVFFIFAEFFDAVNDHFGLSNLITQLVNSFRSITELIPEILLVFFIVMTFSKAIKSTTEFNKTAAPTARWDQSETQKLADGKNPAWAMLEYFIKSFGEFFLIIIGLMDGHGSGYNSVKKLEAERLESEIKKEIAILEAESKKAESENQNEVQRLAIRHRQEDAIKRHQEQSEIIALEKQKLQATEKSEKANYAFNERRAKARQEYTMKLLKSRAEQQGASLKDRIKYAMFLNAGSNIGVNPIQIEQMSNSDQEFRGALENALATGAPLDTIVKNKLDALKKESDEARNSMIKTSIKSTASEIAEREEREKREKEDAELSSSNPATTEA